MKLIPNYYLKRFFSTQTRIKPKICIVGAGTAGFYAAQKLIKSLDFSEVDIIEKLPVPFGLVRFGVAPDHADVKNVISTFTKVAENPSVRFLGNVNFGTNLTLNELRNAYHIILLTYGADESKKLNIPGEDLKNVIEARNIVGWYNGTPWDKNLKIDLSQEVATIFGQGNVAVDIARILLSPIDKFKKTDMTQYALEALSKSKIKSVYLVGRRGPLQAAYTTKELREMLKLQSCSTIWRPEDFVSVSESLSSLSRPKKRIAELMLQSLKENSTQASKELKPIFFRSPIEILGKDSVEKVVLGVTELVGEDILTRRAVLTDKKEELTTGLVIPSIGYKSIQVEENIPFNVQKGLVQNIKGRVDRGLYVSGWLGTGPTGVIVSTMNNAVETSEIILHDIKQENLINMPKGGYEEIKRILDERNVQIVSWQQWERIDKYEQEKGAALGKSREKLTDINKMLSIADSTL